MKRVYTLGSADPRIVLGSSESTSKKSLFKRFKSLFKKEKTIKQPSSFHVFSGSDVRVYFYSKGGTVQTIPELQSYSIDIENGIISADLIFVVFDRSSSCLLSETQDILFRAADEYGDLGYSYLKDISVVKYKHSLSVDDLVSEEYFTLKAKEYCPWIKPWPEPETEEWINIRKMKYRRLKQLNPVALAEHYPREFIEKYFPEDIND